MGDHMSFSRSRYRDGKCYHNKLWRFLRNLLHKLPHSLFWFTNIGRTYSVYIAFDVASKEVASYCKVMLAGGPGNVPEKRWVCLDIISWGIAWKFMLCGAWLNFAWFKATRATGLVTSSARVVCIQLLSQNHLVRVSSVRITTTTFHFTDFDLCSSQCF